jgi:hypothetical protein
LGWPTGTLKAKGSLKDKGTLKDKGMPRAKAEAMPKARAKPKGALETARLSPPTSVFESTVNGRVRAKRQVWVSRRVLR